MYQSRSPCCEFQSLSYSNHLQLEAFFFQAVVDVFLLFFILADHHNGILLFIGKPTQKYHSFFLDFPFVRIKKAPNGNVRCFCYLVPKHSFLSPYFYEDRVADSETAARDFCCLLLIFILHYTHFGYILPYTFIYNFEFLYFFLAE